MRRFVHRLPALACGSALVLGACSLVTELDGLATSERGDAESGASTPQEDAGGGANDAPPVRLCARPENGAARVCDDFDDGAPSPRWLQPVVSGAGASLGIASGPASSPPAALAVRHAGDAGARAVLEHAVVPAVERTLRIRFAVHAIGTVGRDAFLRLDLVGKRHVEIALVPGGGETLGLEVIQIASTDRNGHGAILSFPRQTWTAFEIALACGDAGGCSVTVTRAGAQPFVRDLEGYAEHTSSGVELGYGAGPSSGDWVTYFDDVVVQAD